MLKQTDVGYKRQAKRQPPSGGCVLKLQVPQINKTANHQPPSGGCVLKHVIAKNITTKENQPPSGGCVLKLYRLIIALHRLAQPPSGGCVLKPCIYAIHSQNRQPAAFGRLCVETGGLKCC